MASRKEQKARTRAILLDVATTHFEQHGFDETTIRDIAKDAGVSVGAVFVHFSDKEDLLYHAFYNDLQHITERTIDTVPRHTSIERQLRYIAASFYGTFAQRPALYGTLLEKMMVAKGEWGARFDAQSQEVLETVVELFEESVRKEALRDDISSQVAASAFAAFYTLVLRQLVKNQFSNQTEMLDLFDHLVAQHIKGHKR